jgi:hypothetical protein
VTSLERLLGRPVEVADVEDRIATHFYNIFISKVLAT